MCKRSKSQIANQDTECIQDRDSLHSLYTYNPLKLYKVPGSRSGCKLKINHSRCYNTPYRAGTVCTVYIHTAL